MTSFRSSKVWQDVYRPAVGRKILYVKFTTDSRGRYLLISFKEA
jgi:hypothetical protein